MDIVASKALELIPYLRYPNFSDILTDATSEMESSNSEFLIRMELKRLCTDSVRIIDFRSDGDTEIFEYKGIIHFLQKEDIEDFNRLLDLYDGIYSVGLYEEIVRNHQERKKLKQEEQSEQIMDFNVPNRFAIKKIKFTNYAHRRDERMFYCSPVVITLQDGRTIHAKTSDLSCSGVKFLLAQETPFEKGTKIKVNFTGLIEQFKNQAADLSNIFYEVLFTEKKEAHYYIKTRCIKSNENFEKFILDFQSKNRYRYKVDTDYLAQTLNIQALEHQYLPKVGGIPLFISKEPNHNLLYILKSEFNHEMLNYWRDERSEDVLNTLITKNRISALLTKNNTQAHTYFYSFKHTTQNKVYFFSATREELLEHNLVETFFKMAKTRTSFRVFKFSITKFELEDNAIKQLINTYCSPTSEDLSNSLSQIGYIAYLERIDVPYDKGIYEQYTTTKSANELQRFTHLPSSSHPPKIEYLQFITPRIEPRYIFKTSLSITSDKVPPQVAWTRDISSKGLQVELSEPAKFYNDNVVYVSLQKFGQMRKSMSFTNIPYTVIYVNSAHTILHLKLNKTLESNPISTFINDFIKTNYPSLKQAPTTPVMSDLSKILRSLTISNLFTTPIFFMKGCTNRLGYYCESHQNTDIVPLFNVYKSEHDHLNLYPIFSEGILKHKILETLPKIRMSDKTERINVFIKRTIDEENNINYIPKLEDTFNNINELISYIREGLNNGYYGAFSIRLTGASRPDCKEIENELLYIKRFSPHKYAVLENNLWSVFGIAEITDITESILLKYHINAKNIPTVPDFEIA